MKKYIVLQEENCDCGVASLLSIIRYYNGDANLETLRMDSYTDNSGVNAYNLIECAKKNGFNAKGIKDNNIASYSLPCIIHLKINKSLSHFAVLYKIKGDTYTIMDPAKGLIKMTTKEFIKIFTNHFIVLEPISTLPKKKNNNVIRNKIISQLNFNKKTIFKIISINIIYIVLCIISSFYIKIFNYNDYIIVLSIFFLIINVFINLIANTIYKRIFKLEKNINYNLANSFFAHIFRLPLKYLHLKDPGEIVKRVDEINLINEVIINTGLASILDLLILISVIPLMCFIEIKVLLTIILTFLINYIIIILTLKKLKNKSRKYIDATTDYNNTLIDSIYGLTSIKHSKSEEYVKDKILLRLQEKYDHEKEYMFSIKNHDTLKSIPLVLLKLLNNLYLLKEVYTNNFSFENLIILNILMEIVIDSLTHLLSSTTELYFIRNLFTKANDFYNIPIDNNQNGLPFKNGNIAIKNLTFSYYNNCPLIKKLTTTIKIGEKIIIKGESGSGKSTLCKILTKEINDYTGSICIDNKNIKDINTDSYQNSILYSSQSEKIFSGTILDNILLGKNLSETHIQELIRICKLDRIISKHTFGLDTFLYSGGEELSGGERQLIILARALANEFAILILDETLSEVNDTIEDEVLNNIFNYYKDKTIIYVSHKNKKNYFRKVLNV